ncbi:phage tail fiber C-terminal domain-containing protein [Escherichia coli]|uniref:phage tail fiber C-terminal domain-containing protein n=1 Tax=Escherichia coli TaxID=562 RepID=UPI0039A2EE5D
MGKHILGPASIIETNSNGWFPPSGECVTKCHDMSRRVFLRPATGRWSSCDLINTKSCELAKTK